ncbi:manganese efflux pump MntP family protein [Clostridium polynesiense]|uniref:manganese efflux pump MntP n=1 Tax=Clostridium polynesiense TaxID=1325933 RepID=UPI00058DDAB7|nr:manganese efflux pump MntP family protein [Clostridium polynesiense]
MSTLSIFLMAFGLAMDAMIVSLSLGVRSCRENKVTIGIKAGLYFGLFQGIMPLIGWIMGKNFAKYITSIDHWVAFTLLSLIGGKMIIDAYKEKEEDSCVMSFSTKLYLTLAVATSIDALAVGLSLALVNINILTPVFFIGGVTFILSFLAVIAGEKLGSLFKNKAAVLGGIILIFIGSRILAEHLEIGEILLGIINR